MGGERVNVEATLERGPVARSEIAERKLRVLVVAMRRARRVLLDPQLAEAGRIGAALDRIDAALLITDNDPEAKD